MVAEAHPFGIGRQTVLPPSGVIFPERPPVQVHADAPLQRRGEHGHDRHISQTVRGSFRPCPVVTRPDRPDAAQHRPQPLQPGLRFGNVIVKHQRNVRQEHDLTPGVRVETRHAVGSPVVHMVERNLSPLPKLFHDGVAFLVGKTVPHPVARVRTVPDHRHVGFVIVGKVAGSLRVPTGYGRQPPARGAGISILAAHEIGQRQGLGAFDEPP